MQNRFTKGRGFQNTRRCIQNSHPGFDTDHNSIGYTELFLKGIGGVIADIREELSTTEAESEKAAYLNACEESCIALIKIAHKFSDAAKEKMPLCENDTQRKYMKMIADAARNIPENPPSSFYEGLAMIWFLRETVGTLEGIGISVLGQVDLLVGELYRRDIENGKITEAEACELIRLWLLPTDIKFDSANNKWPETSTCIALGGCDSEGNAVFNEVTEMILKVHFENGLVAPKLNCRYSKSSPDKYLKLISKYILAGHNNFALSCDDIIIPSLMKCGIEESDARKYLNGGCQETMVEGCGHTAGAYLYVLVPEILNLSVMPPEAPVEAVGERMRHLLPQIIESAENFEEFYTRFIKNVKIFLEGSLARQTEIGKAQRELNPCPLFSCMHKGCIENGADYTAGGAKYNVSTICICGIATLIDSLYAIKNLCFDDKSVSLRKLRKALAANREGEEELRTICRKLPKYGHGIVEIDNLANRLIGDLDTIITGIPNERGGKNIMSMFSYYLYSSFAKYIRATPDGRNNGSLLSQGIAASRLQDVAGITEIFDSVKAADYTRMSGISVLDIQLVQGFDEDRLCAFIRASGESGCPNLQPNCISAEELIKAKKDPENHRNLIVRVSGLSVYFVNLEENIKDEIIKRNMYAG